MPNTNSLRILYGVQATGQGHITRARSLGPALMNRGAKVDFLFSGRRKNQLFSMEEFGDFDVRRGLTFHFNNGQINPYATLVKNNVLTWIKDISCLDLKPYDLIITDYEPVTAWAAKIKDVPSIGIGHQYAFYHNIPMKGFTRPTLSAMRNFAPAKTHLGMHWHHFGQPIIPPMIPLPDTTKPTIANKIVVYLYFENQKVLSEILSTFPEYDFFIYAPTIKSSYDKGNLKFRPTSDQFRSDIENCAGVICGAGFELPTEVIHMGKKLLVKAMKGQPEQASNALALNKLGLAMVLDKLDKSVIGEWLDSKPEKKIIFPNAAEDVSEWIVGGDWSDTKLLVSNLWQKTFTL